MFTVTDKDRKLRKEGQSWQARCEQQLMQAPPANDLLKTCDSREEEILVNSLKAILWERTAAMRLRFRQNRKLPVIMAVTVSQRAVEDAMEENGIEDMSEENIRKLVHCYISEDFTVTNLAINYRGSGSFLTVKGHNYTSFFLRIQD